MGRRWLGWVVLLVAGGGCGDGTATGGGGGSASSDGSSDGASATDVTATDVSATAGMTTTSTAGTSVGEGTGSEGASSDGGVFLIDPDLGPNACTIESQCDVWGQDCPDGDKCVPWAADGSGDLDSCVGARCSPLDHNPVAPGGACTVADVPWSGVDDCELGSFCWDVDPATLEGTCAAVCMGSEANPICEAEGSACFIGPEGIVVACAPRCDPLAPLCDQGWSCVVSGDAPPVCVPTSLGVATGHGVPCDHRIGCGDGFACMFSDFVDGCDEPGTCCTALCDPAAPACDAANPVCTPVGDGDGAGACTIE